MPGEITIRSVNGIRVILERLEPSEARETLGVYTAMDGNWREEIRTLREKVIQFAKQLWVGSVKPNKAWYAFIITIMKTLEYPMEATFISKKDWELIMQPMLTIVLQRSRFASTFPRDLLYSPLIFQGLGVFHPWYRQQIVHLLVLCKETFNATPTGELINANAAQLRLGMGTPGSFTDPPIHLLAEYLTTSWLTDLLRFLHKYRISITDPLPQLLPKRKGNQF
jgi:hypothetical protein